MAFMGGSAAGVPAAVRHCGGADRLHAGARLLVCQAVRDGRGPHRRRPGVVGAAGGRLGRPVWSAIGHHLHVEGSPRPEWLRPWLVLLIQNDPDTGQDWLEYALVASRWPEDRAVAQLLFDHLTEPQAVFQL